LDRAIELTLERVHKGLVSLAAQVQDKKTTWERNVRAIQERKEWEEKQEKAQALALADAEALAIASAIAIEATREEEKLRSISILNDCKQRIRSQLPRFERDISDFGFQTAIKKINKNIDEYSYLFLVYEELAKAFGRESLEKENIRLELWWTAEPEILFSLAWGAGSS
jgi:hypothetical protein